MTVSLKEDSDSKLGFYIDPQVSITQSVDSIHTLVWAKCYFQTGKIYLKPDTPSPEVPSAGSIDT